MTLLFTLPARAPRIGLHGLRTIPRSSSFGGARPWGCTQRHISTLKPSLLAAQDFVDLSEKRIHLSAHMTLNYHDRMRAFPLGTRGFFYFLPGPLHAPIAGEVRFRITDGSNPAAFSAGHDLQEFGRPTPWMIPLANILQSKKSLTLLQDLLITRDRLVDERLLVAAAAVKQIRYSQSSIIHSLGQPLVHDLSHESLAVRIASGDHICTSFFFSVQNDQRAAQRDRRRISSFRPYTGRIKCCFEVATIEGAERLVLRVLEIVDPVQARAPDYDGWLPPPVAGELLRAGGGRPWTYAAHEAHGNVEAVRALLGQHAPGVYVQRHAASAAPDTRVMRRPRIRSLRPDLLTASDWMDISSYRQAPIMASDAASGSDDLCFGWNFDMCNKGRIPYPEGTTGFFYVHVPHKDHLIGAQFRFRVVPQPDPALFSAGHDLCKADGTVWTRWIPMLVADKNGGDGLLNQLMVRQHVISREVIDCWKTVYARRSGLSMTIQSPIICPGAERFRLDLSKVYMMVRLGYGSRASAALRLFNPFAIRTDRTRYATPYTGSVIAELIENRSQGRFDLRVVQVLGCERRPDAESSVPAPTEKAVVLTSSGKRLWNIFQELKSSHKGNIDEDTKQNC